MESPIPILPLSTPDVETEKLIKMKDEEVPPKSEHFDFYLMFFVHESNVLALTQLTTSCYAHEFRHLTHHSSLCLQLKRMQEMLNKMQQQMHEKDQ